MSKSAVILSGPVLQHLIDPGEKEGWVVLHGKSDPRTWYRVNAAPRPTALHAPAGHLWDLHLTFNRVGNVAGCVFVREQLVMEWCALTVVVMIQSLAPWNL